MEPVNLAIVDDNEAVIGGLRTLLSTSALICVSFVATRGQALLDYLEQAQPDAILLDLQMPQMSGLELCRRILAIRPSSRILAFSSFDDTENVKQVLQQGAKGYILKNADQHQLVEAITTVAAGGEYIDDAIRKKLEQERAVCERRAMGAIPFTRREKEILKLTAQGYSLQNLAEQLQMNQRAVESHLLHLNQKLGTTNTASLLQEAANRGLLQE